MSATPTYRLNPLTMTTLDIVRLVASQVVVVGHGLSFFELAAPIRPPHMAPIQDVAVVVFFWLSGFLISYSTSQKRASNRPYEFRHFFVDRFARIYGAYFPALLFVAVVDFFHRTHFASLYKYVDSFDLRTLVANVFMLQLHPVTVISTRLMPDVRFLDIWQFGSGRPFWTLAVEWWIYMAFGWLSLRGGRSLSWPVRLLIAGGVVIVPLANLVDGIGKGLTMVWLLGLLSHRLLAANALADLSVRDAGWGAAVFALCAMVRLFIVKSAYDLLFGSLLAAFFLLSLRAFEGHGRTAPKALVKATAPVVAYAYSIYLVHYTVLDLMVDARPSTLSPWLCLLLAFVASNVVAWAFAQGTEVHSKKLADKLHQWFDRRESALLATRASRSSSKG